MSLSRRGATLRGAVRDKATGAPVAAFTVNVWATLGPLRREAYRTATLFDAQGRYEVAGLAPGDYAVTVAAHKFSEAARRKIEAAGGTCEELG